ASKVIKQEYVVKAKVVSAPELKKIALENITNTHMVAMKHIEQYIDAAVLIENKATVSAGQNTKPMEIVECSDGDFSDEELLIVVHDKFLKLNDSEPTEVQRFETEVRPHPVQVHVASNPQVLSSTDSKVDSAPTGVAAEQKEVNEESIVAGIIAKKQ
ncbi:hypothetical protein A2U01_0051870, partial [Trifolium medium]|nr:hypothetical protein [Trifolium medium]